MCPSSASGHVTFQLFFSVRLRIPITKGSVGNMAGSCTNMIGEWRDLSIDSPSSASILVAGSCLRWRNTNLFFPSCASLTQNRLFLFVFVVSGGQCIEEI